MAKPTDELGQIVAILFLQTAESMAITDSHLRILWVNKVLEEISGYTLAELRGNYAVQLFFGALTDPAAVGRIRRGLRRGESCSENLILYRKNGHPYWTHLTYSPVLDSNGFVRAFDVIGRPLPEKALPYGPQSTPFDLQYLTPCFSVFSGTDNSLSGCRAPSLT